MSPKKVTRNLENLKLITKKREEPRRDKLKVEGI